MIPLTTVPGESRSHSHSSWHFRSCPLLLAAGNKFGHIQDKFLEGYMWSVQIPQIVMRAARFTPVFCHQRTQKSFSHSSSFGRDCPVCANVSFLPGIPEIRLDLHSDPASLGTTNTGIVHDLGRSPSHTGTPQGAAQQGKTPCSTAEIQAIQGRRGTASKKSLNLLK